MKILSTAIFTGKKNILYLLSSCIAFYITRSSIPFFKYPFVLLFAYLGLLIFLGYHKRIFLVLKEFSKDLLLPSILFLYLLASCLFSDKIYLVVIKDISSSFILLLLIYFAKVFVRTDYDLKYFLKSFINVIILFSVLISLQRVYQYLFISSYFDQYSDLYISRNREIVDYNFALVPVFFGMAGIFYMFREKMKPLAIFLSTLLLYWFSFSFIISGSKRGLFAFLVIFFALILLSLWSLFSHNKKIKQLCSNSRYFIITFSISLFVIILVFLNSSVYFKNDLLKRIGVKNVAYTKVLISETFFRYFHFFISDTNANGIYQKIWHPVFDPRDPNAAYGSGNYKIAEILPEDVTGMVPRGTKGYYLDSTCLGFASKTHTYYFLEIFKDSVNSGDSVLSSVYCYVSPDFNGNGVALRAEGSLLGNPDSFINPEDKGIWKKLILPISCTLGIVKIYLYMNKAGVSDFSSLKGFVIFAYPEYKNHSSLVPADSVSLNKGKSDGDISGKSVSLVNYSPIKILSGLYREPLKAGILYFPISNLVSMNTINGKSDPIRNWVSKLVSEDTTWHGFRSDLNILKKNDKLGEDRIERWKFAGKVFRMENTWAQKTFGGGFNFLSWYGYCFLDDKTKSDWPHNPFLSVLLYSGLLGLAIYLFLIYKVIYYYLKYLRENLLLFVFFLITFYFSFFSAGSPFDPPVMGFFVLLPFLIHSVHKSANNSINNSK